MSTTEEMNHAQATGSTFMWHELYTPNDSSAVDFYTKALGFEVQEMDMGTGTYKMLARDGKAICGVCGTEGKPEMADVKPQWSVYISVDDVDARAAKCVELGGEIHVPAFDIPTVGRMCLIVDPAGATFWLFKPLPMKG